MTQAICRLCLAIDVRMITIADTPLQAVFEKITNNLLHTTDKRPLAACYFCCAQLKKCHKLILRSVQAENVLTDILQRQPEVTIKSVAMIDRKANKLSEPLSIATLDSVDQFIPTSIAVKHEPEPGPPEMVLVKTEMEYENISSSQPPDIEEHEPTEEIRALNECKAEPQDASDMLEVEIDIEEGGPSQLSSVQQHRPSTPGNIQQNDEITLMNQQDPLNTNTQTSKKLFQCIYCHRRFKWKQCLERHISTHTGEKPYKCDVCQRQFSQAHHLRDHIRTHTGERLHKCNICNVTFRILSSLKRHFNRVHIGEKLYECNVCKSQFEYQKDYNEHLKTHESKPKTIHECDVCHRRFEKKYHLQRHAKVHTGEKPHECTICGRRFSEKRNMLTHVKIHYIEKYSEYCPDV